MRKNINIKKLAMASAIAGALALAGCGGGSDTPPQSLSGTVIDGYIEGATVFLDLNGNQVRDSDEPQTVSKADGAYSLDITGLTIEKIKSAHLVTSVPDTAKDKDDGGKTLAEAGKAPFDLMAPASAFVSADGKTISSAVISPLTTLVSHDMISGNGKSLDDAEKSVRMRMGLDDKTDLKQDFIAQSNAPLHRQAQVVAAAIGEVKKAAKAVNGTSDRDALFAALGYLQQNVAALHDAAIAAPGANVLEQVKAAMASGELKPAAATLIDDAKKVTDSRPVDMMTILADGFYDYQIYCFSSSTNCGIGQYSKTSGRDGQWKGENYTLLSSGTWSKDTASTNVVGDYRLTTDGWVARTDTDSGTYESDGKGAGTATQNVTGKKFRFSSREVDLTGQTTSQIPGVTVIRHVTDPVSAPVVSTPAIFPPGSKMFWSQATQLTEEYRLYASHQVFGANCTTTCSETKLTSLTEVINAYATANASSKNRYLNGNYTFDAGASATAGTITQWIRHCATNGCTYTQNGSVPYEIRTVSGQQVLIIKAKRQYNDDYFMLAVKDGTLLGGSYTPIGAYVSAQPTFNKAAMNTILKTGGKPEVVD